MILLGFNYHILPVFPLKYGFSGIEEHINILHGYMIQGTRNNAGISEI